MDQQPGRGKRKIPCSVSRQQPTHYATRPLEKTSTSRREPPSGREDPEKVQDACRSTAQDAKSLAR